MALTARNCASRDASRPSLFFSTSSVFSPKVGADMPDMRSAPLNCTGCGITRMSPSSPLRAGCNMPRACTWSLCRRSSSDHTGRNVGVAQARQRLVLGQLRRPGCDCAAQLILVGVAVRIGFEARVGKSGLADDLADAAENRGGKTHQYHVAVLGRKTIGRVRLRLVRLIGDEFLKDRKLAPTTKSGVSSLPLIWLLDEEGAWQTYIEEYLKRVAQAA